MRKINVDPESPTGKMLLKMLEDKKLVNAYLRGEVDKAVLDANGIKLVNPFSNSPQARVLYYGVHTIDCCTLPRPVGVAP